MTGVTEMAEMMETLELSPIPQNNAGQMNFVLKHYEDAGVTLDNGFQKDAVQNAIGARKSEDFKGWRCDISCSWNSVLGTYLVVEDSGTVGLTGRNMSSDEIVERMARKEEFEPEERLARFTSLFNSGGNYGPGLYGAGKSVYAIASESRWYYFDSLRDDGKYVANLNCDGQVAKKALEDDEARKFIRKETGLEPKNTVGTRIIIRNPKMEISESVSNGFLERYIQESWWMLMERYPNGFNVTVNGKPVTLPKDFKEAVHSTEVKKQESLGKNCKELKAVRFGLFVRPKDSEENRRDEWQGIYYYRKGMKVGEVDINNIPEKVRNCFWGFIEVNEECEEALSKIENAVHFGVSKGKKKTSLYRVLKDFCNQKFEKCMEQWEYKKTAEEENAKLKKEMENIKADLDNLFDRLKMEDLGKGIRRPNFDVRLQRVRYPNPDSERVTTGDEIAFELVIESRFPVEREFSLNVSVLDGKDDSFISSITKKNIQVRPDIQYKETFRFTVSEYNSNREAKNNIVVTVKLGNHGTGKKKVIPFYYDIDKPVGTNDAEKVCLFLYGCEFPHKDKGSRRVNFDESLKEVSWRIVNRRNCALDYRLNITLHDAEKNDHPLIREITMIDGRVEAFGEDITVPIKEIPFDSATYGNIIGKGRLELRASLVARDANAFYEKGEKIVSCNCQIFFLMDDRTGNRDAYDCESVNDPSVHKRAWCVAGEHRRVIVNTAHPAYVRISNNQKAQREYLMEMMLKQYALLYIAEGKTNIYGDDFDELEPAEAVNAVVEKVEELYYESFQ